MLCDIIRRRHDRVSKRWSQRYCDHILCQLLSEPNARVKALFDDVDDRCVADKFDLDVWVCVQKGEHCRTEQVIDCGAWRIDAKGAGRIFLQLVKVIDCETDVRQGWTEALQLMPVGSKWRLFVPAELAYGEEGAGGVIPPNATLIFEIELLAIQK